MRCSLCDAQRATYPLVFVSKELKVAMELRGVAPERACESCWLAETAKVPSEDMLWALANALTDVEMGERQYHELEEKHDELKKDFKDLEQESERKIDEKDHEVAVDEAKAEGLAEGKREGKEAGYGEGYEDGMQAARDDADERLVKEPAVPGEDCHG